MLQKVTQGPAKGGGGNGCGVMTYDVHNDEVKTRRKEKKLN